MTERTEPLLTLMELAFQMEKSIWTVSKWPKKGMPFHVGPTGKRFFKLSECKAWYEGRKIEEKEEEE